MRVWVTGATGFVGEALVRRLVSRGDDVIAITRRDVPVPGARVVVCALPDLSPLDVGTGPDLVVHCAAQIHGTEHARALHVDAPLALAKRAPHARLVHISTTDVLAGETSELPLDESSPCAPRDVYGRTKLEGELRLREARPDAVILRPPGIYGPNSRGDGVLDIISKIERRRFFHVGDGTARRSWVYVETLVDAILHDLPAGTYLVDDGAPVSRRELASTIARALGRPAWFPHVSPRLLSVVAFGLERVMTDPPITRRAVRFRHEGFPLDTSKLAQTGFPRPRTLEETIGVTVRALSTVRAG